MATKGYTSERATLQLSPQSESYKDGGTHTGMVSLKDRKVVYLSTNSWSLIDEGLLLGELTP